MMNDPVTRLRELVESASTPMIAIDENSNIILVNDGLLRVFEYNNHYELVGQSLDILIETEFTDIHKEHVRKFIVGRTKTSNTMRGISKTGKTLGFDIAFDTAMTDDGQILALGTLRYTNGRQELKDKVDDAVAMVKKASMRLNEEK